MQDNIFDGETGEHIAFIKEGKVYRSSDGLEIGYIQAGNTYAPNGKFIGGLQHLEEAATGQPLPAEFKALLSK